MTEKSEISLKGDTVAVDSMAVLCFVLPDKHAERIFDDWKTVKEEIRDVIERHLVNEEVIR